MGRNQTEQPLCCGNLLSYTMLTSTQIKEFVENNPRLVLRKESKRYPDLFVLKYHNRVFYDNLWTPELMEMRGMVVDADYNIVGLPFKKIFNRFENNTDIPRDNLVISIEKINGFMGAATMHPVHGLIVSTTGSLDSDFVTLAEKYITPLKDALDMGYTYMFEIVDPSDPHIIKENTGAYFLGRRNISTGVLDIPDPAIPSVSEVKLREFGAFIPRYSVCRFSDLVNEAKNSQREGFVVYTATTVLKIKSPYYLTKKLFARIRAEKVTSEWLIANKNNLPEEYYPLVDHINSNRDHFVSLEEQDRLTFIENFFNEFVS